MHLLSEGKDVMGTCTASTSPNIEMSAHWLACYLVISAGKAGLRYFTDRYPGEKVLGSSDTDKIDDFIHMNPWNFLNWSLLKITLYPLHYVYLYKGTEYPLRPWIW